MSKPLSARSRRARGGENGENERFCVNDGRRRPNGLVTRRTGAGFAKLLPYNVRDETVANFRFISSSFSCSTRIVLILSSRAIAGRLFSVAVRGRCLPTNRLQTVKFDSTKRRRTTFFVPVEIAAVRRHRFRTGHKSKTLSDSRRSSTAARRSKRISRDGGGGDVGPIGAARNRLTSRRAYR